MDASAMYPASFHPVEMDRRREWKGKARHYTRTRRPPTYYLIDFGLSQRFDLRDGPALELPIKGGDKTAPEHQGDNYDIPCDPFATDIYYLGSLICEKFLQVRFGCCLQLID